MKGVQLLDFLPGFIQHTLINSVGNAIIDQFCQHQSILAFVEHLKGVCLERQKLTDIWITGKDSIDVPCEFSPLIFIDGVRDICGRTLDLNPPIKTALRNVSG